MSYRIEINTIIIGFNLIKDHNEMYLYKTTKS